MPREERCWQAFEKMDAVTGENSLKPDRKKKKKKNLVFINLLADQVNFIPPR